MGVAVSMTKEMLREVLYQEIEHYHTDSLSKDGQVSRTERAPAQPAPLVWLQGDTRRGDGVLSACACCALLLQVESDSSTERDASSGAEVRPKPLSIQRSACALLRVCSGVTEPVRAERREQVLEAARTARLRVGARCRLRRGGGERPTIALPIAALWWRP